MSRVFGYRGRRRVLQTSESAGAFTLLELLTVIGIVAGLCALSFGMVHGAKERAAIARTKAELAMLMNALEEFKRHYGDYPESTGAMPESACELFRALAGTRGPRGAPLTGPAFVEFAKFKLERPPLESFSAMSASGAEPENAFVDSWGTRYFYFYRPLLSGGSRAAVAPLLFSAGPNGRVSSLPTADGTWPAADRRTDFNADNIYGDELP